MDLYAIASDMMSNWAALAMGTVIVLNLSTFIALLFYRGWMIEEMKKTCAGLRGEIAAMRAEIEQFKEEQEAWHRHIEETQRSPWDIHRKQRSA